MHKKFNKNVYDFALIFSHVLSLILARLQLIIMANHLRCVFVHVLVLIPTDLHVFLANKIYFNPCSILIDMCTKIANIFIVFFFSESSLSLLKDRL